jgi:hypothetical protein
VNGPSAKTAVIRRADPPDGRRRQGSAEMACSTEMRQQTQPDSGSSAVDRLTSMCRVCRSHVGRLTTLRSALVFALPCRVSAILTRLGSVGYPRSRPLGREVPSKSEEACKPTKSRAFRVASADGTHALPMARRRAHSLRPSTDPACSGCSAPPPGDRCDSVFSFSGRAVISGHCVAVPIPGSPAAF